MAEPHELNFKEIRDLANQYFNERFEKANEFLDHASFDFGKERYKMASFMLHQAVENLYFAISLT